MGRARLTLLALARTAAWGSVIATGHALVNLRLLRVPPVDPGVVDEAVTVLLPVRDEVGRVPACLESLLAQEGVPHLEILVLDDCSRDGTAEVVRSLTTGDPRVRVIDGTGPAPGWLGKAAACHELADQAHGAVLVFVDADVRLSPDAIAAAVALLRSAGLGLLSPYPRQEARTAAERLVQPLLQWSWLTFLPVRVAEQSPRPSLVAANGQLMVCDAAAYRAAGGHAAVRDRVLDDLELARAVKRSGHRVAIADGTRIAQCRMYDSGSALVEGYSKSLWAAFGSPAGATAVCAGLLALYVLPPLAAALSRGDLRRAGIVGTAAAVVGRVAVARRVGGRTWPDSAMHPVSVLLFTALTGRSILARRRGTLTWKGRSL